MKIYSELLPQLCSAFFAFLSFPSSPSFSPLCRFSHSRFHSISLIRISIYRLIFIIISSRYSFSLTLSLFLCSNAIVMVFGSESFSFRYSFLIHFFHPIQIFFLYHPPMIQTNNKKERKKLFSLCSVCAFTRLPRNECLSLWNKLL